MILSKRKTKSQIINVLLLFVLMMTANLSVQAKGHFPTETPVEQSTVIQHKKAQKWTTRVKALKQKVKKWRERVRSKSLFGKVAFYTFLGAAILSFTIGPWYLAGVMNTLFTISFVTSIIGSVGGDANRKKAKMMLLVHGIILSIVGGWIAVVLL